MLPIQKMLWKTSVITGNSGVWGLKKNFALLELLEKLQESQEKEAVESWLSKEVLRKERSVSQIMHLRLLHSLIK